MSDRRALYVTRRISETLDISLQNLLWLMLQDVDDTPQDYLQVFQLSECDGKQQIVHTQEVPSYQRKMIDPFERLVTDKVYVVDDGEHLVMMFADEY